MGISSPFAPRKDVLSRSESRLWRGSTYLEVQVALILFALGVSVLAPLAVVNARQTQKLRERVLADAVHYLTPRSNKWSAKLGRPAKATFTAPTAKTTPVTLIDDQDSGFALTLSSNWSLVNLASAYQGRCYCSVQKNMGASATRTFSNLDPYYYEVLVTYPASTSLASNAPIIIFDNSTVVGAFLLNQQVAPSGPAYLGVNWQSLGQFPITSGTMKVRIFDTANKPVATDAVRIRAVTKNVSVLSVQMQPSSAQITVQAQVTP